LLLGGLAALMLAVPFTAEAGGGHGHKGHPSGHGHSSGPDVTVMSRNVFLGADLGPALDATTLDGAIDGAGVIWNELLATNFPERAVALAREIRRAKPDLIGLQEVALWRQQIPSDLGAPPSGIGAPATEVKFDFLALLLQELKRARTHYEVVAAQDEFDEELPVDLDGSNDTGGAFGAELDGRLTMRDVILVRKGGPVRTGATAAAHFTNMFVPLVGGSIAIPVERGWLSVDVRVGGKRGWRHGSREFRFVNTHLEAFGDPAIREAQAKELFAPAGPLDTSKQVILVGDLNSGTAARHNVQGTNQLAFQALLGFGMTDNGAIHTCCYSDLFDPAAVLDHTVDHVLTKPGLRTRYAFVTGDDASERTPSGLWPSDHGGVVSRVRLSK
jgi:endonuclease/exonuclease/phosphatase family metal-dependent hydrolase